MTEPSTGGWAAGFIKTVTDGYDRKARLYPAMTVLVPLVLLGVSFDLFSSRAVEAAFSLAGTVGGSLLLAQLARDRGKRKEPGLFRSWGGMPSVVMFRHSDDRIDRVTKARYHKKMAQLVTEAKAPTPTKEASDPGAADQVYAAWSTYIRQNTRDTKRYALLFQENINFGYRRNSWGLRPIGIATTSIASMISTAWLFQQHQLSKPIAMPVVGATMLVAVCFLLWTFHFTAASARVPADAYAARLAEAIDTLPGKNP